MKKIPLTGGFTDFEGKQITSELTVKSSLLNLIGLAKPKNGEDAIQLLKLGTDLYAAGDEFIFEDAQQALLMQAVEQNNAQYVVLVIGKLAEIVKHAEAFSPNKKD